MTVKELREKLDRMPDDAEVYIVDGLPYHAWKISSASRNGEFFDLKSNELKEYLETYSME